MVPSLFRGGEVKQLLRHTECLVAVPQPKRKTLDGILFLHLVSILITPENISQYFFYIRILLMCPHLKSSQLDLQYGP